MSRKGTNPDPPNEKPTPPSNPPVVGNLIDTTLMRNALDQMKHNMELMQENERLLAKIKYAKFEALVTAGFTEAQALELCKS